MVLEKKHRDPSIEYYIIYGVIALFELNPKQFMLTETKDFAELCGLQEATLLTRKRGRDGCVRVTAFQIQCHVMCDFYGRDYPRPGLIFLLTGATISTVNTPNSPTTLIYHWIPWPHYNVTTTPEAARPPWLASLPILGQLWLCGPCLGTRGTGIPCDSTFFPQANVNGPRTRSSVGKASVPIIQLEQV